MEDHSGIPRTNDGIPPMHTVTVLIEIISQIMIRAGAGVAYFLLYGICPKELIGPDAAFWDRVRYNYSSIFSSLLGEVLHTDRPIRDVEFVGTVDMKQETVERLLWKNGFHRNPIAAIKTRDGVPEIGSWVWRTSPTAERQLHVMLFENRHTDEGVDMYAHEEYSCINPKVAVKHYRGIDQQEQLGVKQARAILDQSETG